MDNFQSLASLEWQLRKLTVGSELSPRRCRISLASWSSKFPLSKKVHSTQCVGPYPAPLDRIVYCNEMAHKQTVIIALFSCLCILQGDLHRQTWTPVS